MDKPSIFAIIPARGGSVGLPRKNIAPVLGRPLLHYTCEAALASRTLTEVILSTDDEEIAAAGREAGVTVPFLRPESLARSDSSSFDVVLHALEWFRATRGHDPEAVVLLQPTSPLRTADDIDESVALFREHRPDTVLSVTEIPHHCNPVSAWRMDDGALVPFMENEGARVLRSQDKPPAYAPNGAIYITDTRYLLARRTLFGETIVPHLMPAERSVDIEQAFDIILAEAALRYLAARREGPDEA